MVSVDDSWHVQAVHASASTIEMFMISGCSNSKPKSDVDTMPVIHQPGFAHGAISISPFRLRHYARACNNSRFLHCGSTASAFVNGDRWARSTIKPFVPPDITVIVWRCVGSLDRRRPAKQARPFDELNAQAVPAHDTEYKTKTSCEQ